MCLLSLLSSSRLLVTVCLIALLAAAYALRTGFPVEARAVTALVTPSLFATSGATYYVAPNGSDNYSGTQSQPFRTIQKAADVVNPGDTVIVEDGTYTGSNFCAGTTAIVCLMRGGTATAKVTFKARSKWGAKLDGQNNSTANGFQFGAVNYIRIEGFEIYGVGNGGSGGASGIELYNGGQGSEIAANNIHDVGRMCTETGNGQNGIFVQQPNVLIERNLIHDIGRFVSGENGCVTTYQASRDHGIYNSGNVDDPSIPGASGTIIKNNIFYNNKRGWSIQVYPGNVSQLKVYNNTFAFENPYQTGHIIMGSSGSDNEIRNNIFYDPKTVALYFYNGTQTNMVVSNNITYSGVVANKAPSGVTLTNNWDNTNPLLFAPLVFDFHLQVGTSPIDCGWTLPQVLDDFDGVARPQGNGYDIGAYELTSTLPTPTPTASPTPTPTPVPTPSPSPSPSPTPNSAPSVNITSPTNGSVLSGQSNITISANASDSDGWIARVDFYENGVLISTITSGPFSMIWNNVSSGTYELRAKATDNLGAATTSAPVSITRRRSSKPRH